MKILEKTEIRETVDGITGDWWKVEGDGKTGFAFSGYISRYPPSNGECYSLIGYLREIFGELTKDNP